MTAGRLAPIGVDAWESSGPTAEPRLRHIELPNKTTRDEGKMRIRYKMLSHKQGWNRTSDPVLTSEFGAFFGSIIRICNCFQNGLFQTLHQVKCLKLSWAELMTLQCHHYARSDTMKKNFGFCFSFRPSSLPHSGEGLGEREAESLLAA